MSIPTKPITEENAAAAIMDTVFNSVDERWAQLWMDLDAYISESGQPSPKSEFAKFHFSLSVLAINFRSAFDLMPRPQAERIFSHMLHLLQKQFGQGPAFDAVKNAILKFIEAYNNGIIAIRNPLQDVAMLYYYKIGLKNSRQVIVDETYFIPEPRVVEFLGRVLTLFIGKWEYLLSRFSIQEPLSGAALEGNAQ